MEKKLIICPHCKNDDESMLELLERAFRNPTYGPQVDLYFCKSCSKVFEVWKDE